jgi:hypothetical protein
MLHPTRLPLSTSGANPQAAPGYRKLVERYTSLDTQGLVDTVQAAGAGSDRPVVVLRGALVNCTRLLTRGQAL